MFLLYKLYTQTMYVVNTKILFFLLLFKTIFNVKIHLTYNNINIRF